MRPRSDADATVRGLVFDTHVNALRHGRANAKRCIADLM